LKAEDLTEFESNLRYNWIAALVTGSKYIQARVLGRNDIPQSGKTFFSRLIKIILTGG